MSEKDFGYNPVRCKNPQCRNVLGFTNGEKLNVGGVYFEYKTTLNCAACGEQRRWVPFVPVESGQPTG